MRRFAWLLLALAGCRCALRDANTVVFLIESGPTSLDPRIGTEGKPERIDELPFDGLVARDKNFSFSPRARRKLGAARRHHARVSLAQKGCVLTTAANSPRAT